MKHKHEDQLSYVRNTAGDATMGNFIDDWEPIGELAWKQLVDEGLITLNADRKVILTERRAMVLGDK